MLGSVARVAERLAALLEELAQERLLPRVASAKIKQNTKHHDEKVLLNVLPVVDFEIFKPCEAATTVTLLATEGSLSRVDPDKRIVENLCVN